MAIDAKIESVYIYEDGSGELNLVDRPARPGGTSGIAGQSILRFSTAPEEVTALTGLNVWGGSSFLMLGDVEIAKRVGYTRIEFYDRKTFFKALKRYREKYS